VHVHDVTDGNWAPMQIVEARLVLDPGIIEFGAHHIDRPTRAWLDAGTGAPVGYCQRMDLWPALEAIAAHAPGGGDR